MLEQKTLSEFTMGFYDSLYSNEEAFNWIKRFNQKMKEMKEIILLGYKHQRVDEVGTTVE